MGKKSTQQEQNEEPVDGVRDADLLEAANEGVVEVPEADMKALMELDNTIKSKRTELINAEDRAKEKKKQIKADLEIAEAAVDLARVKYDQALSELVVHLNPEVREALVAGDIVILGCPGYNQVIQVHMQQQIVGHAQTRKL
jgi:hypothetical protein